MVEIGCIEMIGRVETGRHFHCYFNPDRAMPSEAEAVHGLSDIFLSDKPRFADKVARIARVHRRFAARRAQCRVRFRLPQPRAQQLRPPAGVHDADGRHARAGAHPPPRRQAQPRRLVQPLRGRPLAARQAWRPARRATARAGLCRAHRRAPDRARAGRRRPRQQRRASRAEPALARPYREPRAHHASPDELARHAGFLAQIVNPLWQRFAGATERGAA